LGIHGSLYIYGGNEMGILISDKFDAWQKECEERFLKLKSNEEELNRIFIDIYGLQDELTPEVADKDITVSRIYRTKEDVPESMKTERGTLTNYVRLLSDEIKSLISYAVGCMFGRYSLDVEGLAYAGGEWDSSKYKKFIPDVDNIILITDEEYIQDDDILNRFVEFVRVVYGADTLEENLKFVADALGGRGDTSREIIRNYFVKDFYKDHVKTYKKRPIYWLFDSGKGNGFKALIYLHRYNQDTIGRLRIDCLHRMQRIYESEMNRMRDTIDNSGDSREVSRAQKRLEKLTKQLKETKAFDEKIAHLALARIELDLDDGVKVNYEKVQTGTDGKKYEVLGKI
jgi:type II restriction/modification system DNA methylase subunit YeeA